MFLQWQAIQLRTWSAHLFTSVMVMSSRFSSISRATRPYLSAGNSARRAQISGIVIGGEVSAMPWPTRNPAVMRLLLFAAAAAAAAVTGGTASWQCGHHSCCDRRS